MDAGFLLLWVLFALVGAAIGKTKGRALVGAAWGIFLGPIGWLVIAIAPDVRALCPECGGEIVPGARRCKNCGCVLPLSADEQALIAQAASQQETVEQYKQWKSAHPDSEPAQEKTD